MKYIVTTLVLMSLLCVSACEAPVRKKLYAAGPLPDFGRSAEKDGNCDDQDAQLEKLTGNLHFKKYNDFLALASDIIKKPCSARHYYETVVLVGDFFSIRREWKSALDFYFESLKFEGTRDKVFSKINQVLMQIDSFKTIVIIEKIDNKDIEGQLIYNLASEYMNRKEMSEGQRLLEHLLSKYPSHSLLKKAKQKLAEIKIMSSFDRSRIGVLLPLTGGYRQIGTNVLAAIRLAVSSFNQKHETADFKLYIADTRSTAEGAQAGVEYLSEKQVSCIVGPILTAETAAAAAQRLHIPIIGFSQKSGLPSIGSYVFQSFLTPEAQLHELLSFVSHHYKFTNFAVLFPDDKYGIQFSQDFERLIPSYDGRLTHAIAYDTAKTDFTEEIVEMIDGYLKQGENGEWVELGTDEKMDRNKRYRAKVAFDAVLIPDRVEMIQMIAPQLLFHGIDTLLLGTNLWHSQKILSVSQYVQGAIFPSGFHADDENEKITAFIDRFYELTATSPSYPDAVAYDTTMFVMQALASGRIDSKQDLVSYLQGISFQDTVTCPISFNRNGEPTGPLKLFQIQGKEIQLIQTCTAGNRP